MIVATTIVMQPRDLGGPMNIGIEEPIAAILIFTSMLVLAVAGWMRIGSILTWSYSFAILGLILLCMIIFLHSSLPPREGIITNTSGFVAPDELSILGAYLTSLGLILLGCLCYLIALYKSNKASKNLHDEHYHPLSPDDLY